MKGAHGKPIRFDTHRGVSQSEENKCCEWFNAALNLRVS